MSQNTATQPDKSEKRPHIGKLFAAVRQYNMADGHDLDNPKFLVNESCHKDPSGGDNMMEHLRVKDYTRDELLSLMALAYPEIVSMARELGQALAIAVAAKKDAEEIFHKVTGRKYQEGDDYGAIISDTATVGRQAMDVLRSIAFNTPNSPAKEIAIKFLEHRDTKTVPLILPPDASPRPPQNS